VSQMYCGYCCEPHICYCGSQILLSVIMMLLPGACLLTCKGVNTNVTARAMHVNALSVTDFISSSLYCGISAGAARCIVTVCSDGVLALIPFCFCSMC
jgi:hypothetical protein